MTTVKAPLPRPRPTRRRSAHGVEFDILEDVWVLRVEGGRISINWRDLKCLVTTEFERHIRGIFAKIVAVHPGRSCEAYAAAAKALLREAQARAGSPIGAVDAATLAGWISSQPSASHIPQIKALLGLWRSLRGNGVDDEAFDLAERMNVPQGNAAYANVLTWDENDGPYRPAEDEAIRVALDDAFNEGIITIDDYAFFRLLRGTGSRIESLADLKVEDLRDDGGRWFLRIPMKKLRGVAGWRVQFMPWKPISQGLAHVLTMHIQTNIRPRVAEEGALGLAPLFPAARAKDLLVPTAHRDKRVLFRAYATVLKELAVVSPVTGRVILGNPRRDRHTYLTMLAMNGCTADEIAANAGHSSPASCEPYVDAAIGHFQRMEKLVGAAFIPIADRFLGAVTTKDADARAKDPILTARATGVGSCSVGGCNAIEAGVAPLACYTCRKFRAWADAPHADLLEMLVEEVDRLRADGHATVAETRVPTIIAIGDLLERIRQEEELADG